VIYLDLFHCALVLCTELRRSASSQCLTVPHNCELSDQQFSEFDVSAQPNVTRAAITRKHSLSVHDNSAFHVRRVDVHVRRQHWWKQNELDQQVRFHTDWSASPRDRGDETLKMYGTGFGYLHSCYKLWSQKTGNKT